MSWDLEEQKEPCTATSQHKVVAGKPGSHASPRAMQGALSTAFHPERVLPPANELEGSLGSGGGLFHTVITVFYTCMRHPA